MNRKNKLVLERIEELLEKIGLDTSKARYTNNNLMIRCPFASVSDLHKHDIDNKPSMGIGLIKGGIRYNCFTCNERGKSIVDFINALKNKKVIRGGVNGAKLQLSLGIELPKYGEQIKSEESERRIDLSILTKRNKDFYAYNKKRNLLASTLVDCRVGYNDKERQIVFPCYDYKKKLQGYVARYTYDRDPKYVNDVDRAKILYLEWLIKGRIGIVVEGMYDAIKIYQYIKQLDLLNKYSVVGLFGAKVAKEQLGLLSMYFSSLILMGDNDKAGINMEKSIYKSLCRKMPFIFGLSYVGHDPDSISLKHFQYRLKRIKLYNNNELRMM